MHRTGFVFLFMILTFSPSLQAAAPEAVERFVLPNGMTFLLLARSSPSISFEVRIKAGGMDEPQGKTGLTHMLEHMMFKGTRAIGTTDYAQESKLLEKMDEVALALQRAPKDQKDTLQKQLDALAKQASQYQVPGEFDNIYTRAGGIGLNASTSPDMTSYHITLPRGRLELWASMESERMLRPVFREFYAEREVVLKERAQRVDSSDKGTIYEKFLLHAFEENSYRTPVIGFRQDVERLTRQDLIAYYEHYYRPGNTFVAIVGGFDPAAAKEILRRYFGRIPGQGKPVFKAYAQEAFGRAQVRLHMASQEEPFMLIGFHKPKLPLKENMCFDILEEVLTDSESARLERALVDTGLSGGVDSYNGYPGTRSDNLFIIAADPLKGHTNQELEKLIARELERIRSEGISAQELARAKRAIKKELLQNMESDAGAAGLLSAYEALTGNYALIYQKLELVEEIDLAMITEYARTYLRMDRAVVAYLGE